MTGAIAKGPLFNGHPQTLRFFNSNVTLTRGDLVNVQDNQLEIADLGEVIAGIVKKDATSSSTNVAVNVTPYLTFLMDNDNVGTTFAATHANSYFFDILTTATALQKVDTSSADAIYDNSGSGQLVALEYNPEAAQGDVSVGLFMINPKEKQF